MPRHAISPNFFQEPERGMEIYEEVQQVVAYDPNLIETKLMIHKDRVNGWFLDVAERLKEDNEAGFVILMICLAHLEGMAQYRREQITNFGESSQILKEELKRIFTIPSFHSRAIDILVEDARHGLFHDCMTRRRVFLSGQYLSPIIWDEVGEVVLINPHSFLDAIRADFERFILFLADPENIEERRKFQTIFDR